MDLGSVECAKKRATSQACMLPIQALSSFNLDTDGMLGILTGLTTLKLTVALDGSTL